MLHFNCLLLAYRRTPGSPLPQAGARSLLLPSRLREGPGVGCLKAMLKAKPSRYVGSERRDYLWWRSICLDEIVADASTL